MSAARLTSLSVFVSGVRHHRADSPWIMAAPEVLSDDGLGDSMDEDSDRANFFSSDEEGEIEMRMSGELGSESTAPLPSNDGDTADVLQSSPFSAVSYAPKRNRPPFSWWRPSPAH